MADKKISALTAATTPVAGTEVLPIVQSSATVKVSIANLTAGRSVGFKDFTANSGAANQESRMQYSDNTAGRTVILRMSSSNLAPYDGYGAYIKATQGGGVDVHSLAFGTTIGTPSDKLTIRYDGLVTVEKDNIVMATAGKGIDFSANAHAAGMTSELLNWYEEGTWTPVIRGSGTAGTYELAVAYGKYTRVGNQVTLTCGITLAGAVTGGGTGDLQITGMPFAKAANTSCAGAVFVSGIAFNGYLTVSTLTRASSSILYVVETVSNTAVAQVPVSAVGVDDIIDFTLSYTV